MMVAFKEALTEEVSPTTIEFEEDLDVHHNYATLENHFGKNVWLHRKGAISAKEGELGIIPGSQGSNSYIIKGKGNRDSFMSCPHGAGRRFGRNEACKRLDIKEETEKMKGIVFDNYGSVTLKGKEYPNLQEAEGAYKDINEVMENSEDLCEIITKLRPLGSVKGHDRRSKNG
jgi:tRNA-splicing ligase RtcB